MKNNKILGIFGSMVSISLTTFLSIYAAIAGAKVVGHSGGSWGWGFMLAVPAGFILGLILSSAVIAKLKQKQRLKVQPILFGNAIALAMVFFISSIFHGLLRLFH